MAIRRKEDKVVPKVPHEIEEKVDLALEARYLSDYFATKKDGLVQEAMNLIEHDDRVELVIGEGFRTKHGMIIVAERQSKNYNVELIEEKLQKGEISIADFLACVTITSKIEEILPEAVTIGEPKQYTQLRKSPTWDKQMQEKHGQLDEVWLRLSELAKSEVTV